MGAEVAKWLITVEDYYKMAEVGILKPTDRVELINGEIIKKMSPVGSKHAGVVKRLNAIFNKLFGGEYLIGVQDPVRLDDQNEPEPDISVLRYRSDDYAEAHPGPKDILTVIEVASTSLKIDREVKLPLYAKYGIPIYWIVDLDCGRIEVYEHPAENSYGLMRIFQLNEEIPVLGMNITASEILK